MVPAVNLNIVRMVRELFLGERIGYLEEVDELVVILLLFFRQFLRLRENEIREKTRELIIKVTERFDTHHNRIRVFALNGEIKQSMQTSEVVLPGVFPQSLHVAGNVTFLQIIFEIGCHSIYDLTIYKLNI